MYGESNVQDSIAWQNVFEDAISISSFLLQGQTTKIIGYQAVFNNMSGLGGREKGRREGGEEEREERKRGGEEERRRGREEERRRGGEEERRRRGGEEERREGRENAWGGKGEKKEI